jgi:DDE superfamily endonuclease
MPVPVIEFLKRLIHNAQRSIFLVVDVHPSHRAKIVTRFVESTEGRLRLFFLPGIRRS